MFQLAKFVIHFHCSQGYLLLMRVNVRTLSYYNINPSSSGYDLAMFFSSSNSMQGMMTVSPKQVLQTSGGAK